MENNNQSRRAYECFQLDKKTEKDKCTENKNTNFCQPELKKLDIFAKLKLKK